MRIWPFRSKNKAPSTVSNVRFTHGSKRRSFISIGTALFLSIGTLGASVCGITFSVLNYKVDSNFEDAYNIRIPLDTTHLEDPTTAGNWDDEALQNMVNKSANAYSEYLMKQGISTFNVYPEFIPASPTHPTPEAYISAIVPKKKVIDPDSGDAKTKIEKPQASVYMDDVTNNRLSMLLALYDTDSSSYHYQIINQEDIVNQSGKNNFTINQSNSKQIDIHLKDSFKNIIDKYFPADTNSGVGDDKDKQSEIYFIRDMSGMISRMNFDLQAYYLSWKDPDQRIYDLLPSEDRAFVQAYNPNKTQKGAYLATDPATDTKFETFSPDLVSSSNGNPTAMPGGSDFFRWIDWNWNGKDNDNYQSSAYEQQTDQTGKTQYFTNQYVMGIATKSTVDTFFPKKNPKNKNDTNRDWLTIELKSNYDATQAVNDYNKLSTTLMTQTLMNTNPTDPGAANNIIDLIDNNITITDPSLHQNVFGFSSLLGMVIALAIMVLLIGILVGVLYRVPGIFAFLAILATVSMTVMTLLLAGYTLSLGMIIGALVIAFVSLIVALGFGERIKRQLKSGVKFNAAVRTGLKKGIWPAIDLCFVLLVIGIICVYMGSLTLSQFSMTLVIGSLFILGIMVFIWLAICYFFFNNNTNLERQTLMFSHRVSTEDEAFTINNRPIITSFANAARYEKWKLFNPKQVITKSNFWSTIRKPGFIISVLFLAVMIAGATVMLTIGIHTSYVFFGGTRLVLSQSAYYAALPQLPTGYTNMSIVAQGTNLTPIYYIYYSHALSDDFISFVRGLDSSSQHAYVQNIAIGGLSGYLTSIVFIMLICSAIIAGYAFIRLNWTAIIPTFITTIILPMIITGIIAIGQIYIDTNVVLALVTVYTINTCMVINGIGIIKNSTIKQQIFSYPNLKQVIKKELINSSTYLAYLGLLSIVALACFAVLTATNLISFFIIIIIAIAVILIFMYTTLPMVLAWFIMIRYKYLRHQAMRLSDGTVSKSYDVVDEQAIESINHFHRKRIVM